MKIEGQTTSPADSAGDSVRLDRALGIRWVFPTGDAPATMLDGPAVRLGRGDDCDVVLDGQEASRHHAEILRDGPLHVVRDLDSRNGTYVDGVRLREAPLSPGRVLRLGDWVGVVVETSRTSPSPAGISLLAPGVWGGPKLAAVLGAARAAASSDLPIVIEGETGTGKECVAHAIHAWSGRSGPFLAVNCAALPEALAEGELFGYRKGAFTGADRANPGHFRAAEGGTLLLDEIADLPGALQAKLLRVLEEREVVPLGESRPVPIDVRVLAASQEPLGGTVKEKRFRADLYARLDGLTLSLPTLRERVEDVPGLLSRFLAEELPRAPALSAKIAETLCVYDWPFNVRELRLLARRIAVLHPDEAVVQRAHLPARMREERPSDERLTPTEAGASGDRNETDLERLLAALREHAGNVARAARAIGVSRQRAYRLMHAQPDIDLDEFRGGEAGETRA